MNAQTQLRILVVEDDENIQGFLRQLLSSQPWAHRVDLADTIRSLKSFFSQPAYDLVLLDVTLPDGQTTDYIADLREHWPRAKILVFTHHEAASVVLEAFQKGADGYLLKNIDETQLLHMIEEQMSGGTPMSPAIAGHLLIQLRQQPQLSNPLSDREFSVLKLLAKGCTHDDICDVLAIKKSTVATYVRRIYEKLDVRNRSEAIFEANQAGWLKLE